MPAAERHPQWEQRLHDYLASVHDRPHVYGAHDCLIHAGRSLEAVIGEDHWRPHRGKYRSPAGAVRYLRKLGFDSPEQLIDARLDEKPIGFAQRGDIVLVPGNAVFVAPAAGDQPGQPNPLPAGWNIPAVVFDGDVALVIAASDEREGLHRIPRAQWLKAWRVGAFAGRARALVK